MLSFPYPCPILPLASPHTGQPPRPPLPPLPPHVAGCGEEEARPHADARADEDSAADRRAHLQPRASHPRGSRPEGADHRQPARQDLRPDPARLVAAGRAAANRAADYPLARPHPHRVGLPRPARHRPRLRAAAVGARPPPRRGRSARTALAGPPPPSLLPSRPTPSPSSPLLLPTIFPTPPLPARRTDHRQESGQAHGGGRRGGGGVPGGAARAPAPDPRRVPRGANGGAACTGHPEGGQGPISSVDLSHVQARL